MTADPSLHPVLAVYATPALGCLAMKDRPPSTMLSRAGRDARRRLSEVKSVFPRQ
jgi:hypothetical protein